MDDKDKEVFINWGTLIFGLSKEEVTKKWDHLITGGSNEQEVINSEAVENWNKLVTNGNDDDEALGNWKKLLDGKIVRPKESKSSKPQISATSLTVPSPAPSKAQRSTNLLSIASPAPSRTSQSSGRSSIFKNWQKLVSRTPPKYRKPKPGDDSVRNNWDALLSGTDVGSKEDKAFDNWNTMLSGHSNYELYKEKQTAGVKKLYEKIPTYEDDTRALSLKVKNKKGVFHNVQMKLSSPDRSILSAHIAENNDGTFTIFCCPRIDNDFNMFVSLSGNQFKHEIKVLNFYGSFAGIRKSEADLACQTISLFRWHLTPGLLSKKGDKIVARKESRPPSSTNTPSIRSKAPSVRSRAKTPSSR